MRNSSLYQRFSRQLCAVGHEQLFARSLGLLLGLAMMGTAAAQEITPEIPLRERGPQASTATEEGGIDPRLAADLATLRDNGIEPTKYGALEFLASLRPGPEQQAAVAELVAELGDPNFAHREEAMQQLLRSGGYAAESLQTAAAHEDLEIRWRAQLVMRQSEAKSAAALLAAFRVLAQEPVEGSCGLILETLPLCKRRYLVEAGQAALLSAAGPNDLDLLRRFLARGEAEQRIGAVRAIAKLLPAGSLNELAPLLNDQADVVALATARVFANIGDRRALSPLVESLGAEKAETRSEAFSILRMATGQSFRYSAHLSEGDRVEAISRWREWLRQYGETAELKFPLTPPRIARGDLGGNTLVSTGGAGVIEERDPTGKVLWSYPLGAWSAEKLINGNVLIGSYNSNTVVEIDSAGKAVWRMDGISAMRAKPLPGDRVLVADFNGRRVLEIDREQQIVWQYATPAECFDCERLANGNTLYGCPNLVAEVTPDGVVVREWKIGGRLNGFQSLENGNLLVANYGENRCVELTESNEIVWEFAEEQPCDVFRAPTGETLISTAKRIIELGVDNKTVKILREAQYGSARR